MLEALVRLLLFQFVLSKPSDRLRLSIQMLNSRSQATKAIFLPTVRDLRQSVINSQLFCGV